MTDDHTFQAISVIPPLGAVKAGCSCGWMSAYTHAYEKYAADDHVDHVEHVGVFGD